ncbi:hypothetical protein QQS21_004392 [Conoideocrella luteorostrata]|uniref:SGNH hydrolase-type esterase domain-containing protein n=1 Tax=Conoideocrella luteorostrata TaxID=1105319 RepID=A0AAJ0CRG7_9HYPO|nr:hypothetical protein QQS21_004392 [Conoideocrella luteorostrata]
MKPLNLSIVAAILVAPAAMADDLKAASDAVYAKLHSPSFVPYKKPKQRITEWIALGDSYTAGTGANGKGDDFAGEANRGKKSYPMKMSMDHDSWEFINGDKHLPQFSFHAYTSDTTKELKEEQLKQGIFKDDFGTARGQLFGKPQIATLTIGGNDALLAKILNACVYQYWTAGDCDNTLDELDKMISSNRLKYEVTLAIEHVVASGRLAGGATPAESFQVYIPEYVTFFSDDMGSKCDDYSWGTLWVHPKLTVRLRERLNEFTRRVNKIIKDTA